MKHRIVILLILLLIAMQPTHSQTTPDNTRVIELDRRWNFAAEGDSLSYPAVVPGTVHADLLRNGLLDNPFYGTNEEKVAWVETKGWSYTTTFTVDADDLARYSCARLIFEGLDTFARIVLNGEPVMQTDNMFVAWEKEVRDKIVAGENTLTVHFASPLKAVEPIYRQTGIDYPADNDRSTPHLSAYARKAPYHYGWDWGIRLVGCGIWRPARLVLYDGCRIDDAFTRTLHIDNDRARLATDLTIVNENRQAAEGVEVLLTIAKAGKKVAHSTRRCTLQPGENRIGFTSEIEQPQLWQPNGWGEAHLYDVDITLVQNGRTLGSKHYQTGIRTIEFVNERDSLGRNFYFRINGQPLFAKGTNYIPQDIILTRVTPDDYTRLFRAMKQSHMNMVRVWGGGVYEDELFYQLADRYGILVWQDFMFACSAYPGDPDFLGNVAREARYNIRRLRNHPSLALWCGNNEIYEGLKYWGWNRRYTPETFEKMRRDYHTLFRDTLAAYVRRYDPQRSYIHTSPDSANWGRPATQTQGDIHYWGIWYGQEMFDAMDTLQLRFVSEFGFESFPEMKTLRTFAGPDDLSIDSEVMTHRQKSSIGNDLIKTYMQHYYRMPRNFDDFVYLGLLLQGHGIAYGIETNRRQRPVCMGSLYWQLNDSWPAISWSAIDYYKNKKALYYHARDAFAPLMLSTFVCGDSLEIHALSDRLDRLDRAQIVVGIDDFHGNRLNSVTLERTIRPNASQKMATLALANLLKGYPANEVLLTWQIHHDGKVLARGHKFLVLPKELKLPRPHLTKAIETTPQGITLTLSTDCLAKDVFIEIPTQGADFSDNFFDLLPGERKVVTIEGANITPDDIARIRIRTLTDTYEGE